MSRARDPRLDWMKAAAILAVVVTHAGPIGWASGAVDDLVRIRLVAFQVPMFFVVVGILLARHGATVRAIAIRCRNILLPYTIATIVVTAVQPFGTAPDVVRNWLTGSALMNYYFVPAYVMTLLLFWPLAFASRHALVVAAVMLLIVMVSRTPTHDLLLAARDPFRQGWLLYVVLGWLLEPLLAGPRTFLGAAGLLLAIASYGHPTPLLRVGYTLGVAGILCAIARPSRIAAWLGNATLAIYLYHRLAQLLALSWFPAIAAMAPVPRIALLTAIGLAASTTVVVIGRRLLGPRSRLLIGA